MYCYPVRLAIPSPPLPSVEMHMENNVACVRYKGEMVKVSRNYFSKLVRAGSAAPWDWVISVCSEGRAGQRTPADPAGRSDTALGMRTAALPLDGVRLCWEYFPGAGCMLSISVVLPERCSQSKAALAERHVLLWWFIHFVLVARWWLTQ